MATLVTIWRTADTPRSGKPEPEFTDHFMKNVRGINVIYQDEDFIEAEIEDDALEFLTAMYHMELIWFISMPIAQTKEYLHTWYTDL